ncbi:MAG: hypothetical protein D6736_11055 [Nitrospinota bacterium]|nr:MAG: hypothetical protein D6736_11055 [Nitrospinota bacterium]
MPVTSNRKHFWYFLLSLGGVMGIGFFIAFLYAAPAMPLNEEHTTSLNTDTCVSCHLVGDEATPAMPHRPFPGCRICHGE